MRHQTELEKWGVRAFTDARERAREYRKQLDEIVNPQLYARFWDEILARDPEAARILGWHP